MSSWLPFTLFAFVASITPGPTNLLILAQSSRRGWQHALPAVFGASLAAAMIVLVVGGVLVLTQLGGSENEEGGVCANASEVNPAAS